MAEKQQENKEKNSSEETKNINTETSVQDGAVGEKLENEDASNLETQESKNINKDERWSTKVKPGKRVLTELQDGTIVEKTKPYLHSLWDGTRVFTIEELVEVFKKGIEAIKDNLESAKKERVSHLMENLPEPLRQKGVDDHNDWEGDNVETYKKQMESLDALSIKKIMYITKNIYQMRACIDLLSDQGQLPMDSPEFVRALNNMNLQNGTILKMVVSAKAIKVKENDVANYLNRIYGPGEGTKIWNNNQDSYDTSKFEKTNKDTLNAVDNGYENKLLEMLESFKNGEYVDPREYEAVLILMIDKGKGSVERQMFLFLSGLTVLNEYGETILPLSRVPSITKGAQDTMPLFAYFKQKAAKIPYEKYLEYYKKTTNNGKLDKKKMQEFIMSVPANFGGSREVTEMVLLKANTPIDRDQLHFVLPLLGDTQVGQLLNPRSGDNYVYNKVESYVFGLFGFGSYIKNIANGYSNEDYSGKKEISSRICELFTTFIKIEGALAGNYLGTEKRIMRVKGDDKLNRVREIGNHNLSDPFEKRDKPRLKEYSDSIFSTLEMIIEMYGNDELLGVVGKMKNGEIIDSSKGLAGNDKYYNNLRASLEKMVASDNGAKMISSVGGLLNFEA